MREKKKINTAEISYAAFFSVGWKARSVFHYFSTPQIALILPYTL